MDNKVLLELEFHSNLHKWLSEYYSKKLIYFYDIKLNNWSPIFNYENFCLKLKLITIFQHLLRKNEILSHPKNSVYKYSHFTLLAKLTFFKVWKRTDMLMKSYDNKQEILLGQVKFNQQSILFVGQKRIFIKRPVYRPKWRI